MVHLQYYPARRYRLFVKSGFGVCHYKNNRPLSDKGNGYAIMIDTGFENYFGKGDIIWGVQLSHNYGKLRYRNLLTPAVQRSRRFQVVDLSLFIDLV